MLRYLAPYLTVAMIVAVSSAIGYSTGKIDAAGVYGIMWVVAIITGIGAVRWEERDSRRRSPRV